MPNVERQEAQRLWEGLVVEFSSSGMSGPQWCAKRGYKLRQLRYWQHKLKTADALASGPQWLAVPAETLPTAPILTIQVAGARIDVGSDFNPLLLRAVVEALV